MADAAIEAAPAAAEAAGADAPAPAEARSPAAPVSVSGGADPAALVKQYSAEFQSAGDEYKAKTLALQGSVQELVASLQASLLAQRDAALIVLSNTADASAPPAKVLSIFLWSSVLVLAASASFSLGANLLHHFVGVFLGAFAALIAVPLYAYHYSLKGSSLADNDARFALLGYASLAGLLLGSSFAHLYICAEPFAFLLPAMAGSAYYYAAPAVGSSRVNLLAASLGSAYAALFAVGVLLGSASVSYLAFAAFYSLAGFVVLQYIYAHGAEPTHVYQLAYLTGFLYAKALGLFLFGSRAPYEA